MKSDPPAQSIEVDDTMRRARPRVAIRGRRRQRPRALLTHMGKYQARLAADHILGRTGATTVLRSDGRLSPRVIFTEPQVAAVGTAAECPRRWPERACCGEAHGGERGRQLRRA